MPFQAFVDDVINVPALQIPIVGVPARFKNDRGFLPRVLHMEIDDILRIIILHMAPLPGMETTHITEAVYTEAHFGPMPANARYANRIMQQRLNRRFGKPIEVRADNLL